MAKKVSSKRLASIAGRVLTRARRVKKEGLIKALFVSADDAIALAASVLTQHEPKAKKGKKAR